MLFFSFGKLTSTIRSYFFFSFDCFCLIFHHEYTNKGGSATPEVGEFFDGPVLLLAGFLISPL